MLISIAGSELDLSLDSVMAIMSKSKLSSVSSVLSLSMWRVIEWMFKWKIEYDLAGSKLASLNSCGS